MKILGLDLSLLSTGVCILEGEPGETPKCRALTFPQPKADDHESRISRLISIAEMVVGLVEKESPDHVIIEAPAKNQPWQAANIGEIHGVVKVQMYLAFGIVPMVKEATEMRKVVVGKIERKYEAAKGRGGRKKRQMSYGKVLGKSGRMRKATVKDIIEKRLLERGLQFRTQDEMDAYVAAEFCWREVAPPSGPGADDEEEENARSQPGMG